jgi:hypothetical protein
VVGVLVTSKAVGNEVLETLGAEVEAGQVSVRSGKQNLQLLAFLLLLLFGKAVLCLSNLKLALAFEGDETDTEVGSSKVDGEVLALLLTSGPLWG